MKTFGIWINHVQGWACEPGTHTLRRFATFTEASAFLSASGFVSSTDATFRMTAYVAELPSRRSVQHTQQEVQS